MNSSSLKNIIRSRTKNDSDTWFLKNLKLFSDTSNNDILPEFMLKKSTASNQTIITPGKQASEFFEERYFETLYSTKMPLYYFAKSSISRLESVYKQESSNETPQNSGDLKELLKDFILDIDSFDSRHPSEINLEVDQNNLSPTHAKLRKLFIESNHLIEFKERAQKVSSMESTLSKFTLYLKIREAQMQVLLLLQYLYADIGDISDSRTLLTESEVISKGLARRTVSLIRNRKANKRKSSFIKEPSGLVKKRLLNTYLDRLLIYDVINETSAHVDDKKVDVDDGIKDEQDVFLSTYNIGQKLISNELLHAKVFLRKVIYPYFYYKCPKLIKFIKTKISGDLTSTSTSKKKSESVGYETAKESKEKEKEKLLLDDDTLETLSFQSKSLKRRKTEADLTSPKPSSLTRSKTIAQRFNKELHRAPTKSLSKSGSLVTLSRREIDFGVTKKQKVENKVKKNSILTSKMQLQPTLKMKSVVKSISQIEASPDKVGMPTPIEPGVNKSLTSQFKKLNSVEENGQIDSDDEIYSEEVSRVEEILASESNIIKRGTIEESILSDDEPLVVSSDEDI